MKNHLLTVVTLLCSYGGFAQTEPGIESAVFRLEKGTFSSNQVMIGKKIPPADVLGDYYLSSEWQEGSFRMKDGRKSASYPLRYDVENALLEIRWKDEQVKVVGEEYLFSFVWQNKDTGEKQKFINAHQFSYADTQRSGFVELLYAGEDSLLIQTEIYLKAPTYVEGLDMGKRNAEILKKDKVFVCRKAKLSEIGKRIDLLALVEEPYQKALKKFLRAERIDAGKREDMYRCWKFYESIRDNL